MRTLATVAVALLAALAAAPAHAAFTSLSTEPDDGILNIVPSHPQGRLTITFMVDVTGTVRLSGDGVTTRTIDIDNTANEFTVTIAADEIDIINDFFDITLEHEPETGSNATTTVAVAIDATIPDPPSDIRISTANRSLVLTWSGHVDFPPPFDINVEQYIVYFAPVPLTSNIQLTAATNGAAVGLVAGFTDAVSTRTIDFTNNTTIGGLRNGVTYYFAIEAIDHAGNRSGLALDRDGKLRTVSGIPVQTATLSESTAVDDRCFIATAALGGDSRWLDTYRAFRDRVLLALPGGRWLVESYYRHSPPWARYLETHPIQRRAVRALLLAAAPAVALAAAAGPAPWLLLAGAVALLARRYRRRTALVLALGICASTTPAAARDAYDPEHALSLQTGPLQPKDAQRLAINGRLLDYRDVYGPTGTYRIEVAYDWYPFAWAGRWGIGGRTGIALDRGQALAQNAGSGELVRTGEDTTFLFFPSSINLKYRGYWVDLQPLIPVLETGFDFWPTNEKRDSGGDATQNFVYGWHVGGELELSLNWIEPSAAFSMERNYGIHGTSIFAGYHYTRLDDFGAERTFDFSNHDWLVGLRFLF